MNNKITIVQQLAQIVSQSSYEMISQEAINQLKIRILDGLGCAIAAQNGEPIQAIREHIEEFGGKELTSLIGGSKTSPDRSAFYNSALVRYLDFNDSYLAKGETCHPSDNMGAILAAVEYANGSGKDFLLALAVAYQVQCRLSDVAPVRHKGFDHTVQGQYAAAAGAAKALNLDAETTAHAISISATAHNALRVTRTGELSHWKGLAYAETAMTGLHSAFLARQGITGPAEVFEGNKGFMWSIADEFEIDWLQEDLERVTKTIVKKFNAEIHSQATLEGSLELKQEHKIDPQNIEKIEIDTFDVAFHIIGGGEEGSKTLVRRKEEADHSLPYMVAVALLDDQVLPQQYDRDRIMRDDVQNLLHKVEIREKKEFSEQFPERMPCDIVIHVGDQNFGHHKVNKRKMDYEGFHTRPMTIETESKKFHQLVDPLIGETKANEVLDLIQNLEAFQCADLCAAIRKE